MSKLIKLALENGAEPLPFDDDYYKISESQLKSTFDALLAEHLAVNSGEPVAWMDSNDDVITNKRKDYLLDNDIGEEYDTPLYTANPLNQELLDAVNDCKSDYEYLAGLDIEHIAGLKEWLKTRSNALQSINTPQSVKTKHLTITKEVILKYCELTNRDPNGSQSTTCEGVWVHTTFYDKAKRELELAIEALASLSPNVIKLIGE